MAKKYHPDSNKGKEEQFKEVNEAYQVLSDEKVKKEYDEVRTVNSGQSGPSGNQHNYSSGQSYSSGQNQYNNQNSQYRGYQRQEGWGNKSYR